MYSIREKERMGNNEMRVGGMDYSLEKYVKTHFYRQLTSDLNTYDFLVDNTSKSSSQQFIYLNTSF